MDARVVELTARRSLPTDRIVRVDRLTAALTQLESRNFDAALLDLGLPDAQGDDAVRALRRAASSLPIVVLTGNEDDSIIERVVQRGAEDYLPKADLNERTLRRAISHAIELRRVREQARHERREAKKLQGLVASHERLAAIGRIAAGVAHEINNPATFITTNLELCTDSLRQLEDELSPFHESLRSLRQSVTDSLSGIRRIATVVRDLHGFARVNSNEVELIHLEDVFASARNMLASHFRQGVQLDARLESTPAIAAHPGKLVQVITNLMSNAIDALATVPADRRTLIVEVRELAGWVELSIRDNGPGMSASVQARAFDAFFSTKGSRGVGLGLALCSEIANAHRGTLNLQSVEGEGTSVCLRLPLDTGLQLDVVRLPTPDPRTPTKPRVLILDDEPLVLTSLGRLLADECEVEGVGTGLAGLERVRKTRPDVIICDLGLPDIDGAEVYERLLRSDPSSAARMVFFTGGAVTERLREFLARPSIQVLHKPASRDVMLQAIRRTVSGCGLVHRTAGSVAEG